MLTAFILIVGIAFCLFIISRILCTREISRIDFEIEAIKRRMDRQEKEQQPSEVLRKFVEQAKKKGVYKEESKGGIEKDIANLMNYSPSPKKRAEQKRKEDTK